MSAIGAQLNKLYQAHNHGHIHLADDDELKPVPKWIDIKGLTAVALKNVYDGFEGMIEPGLFSITYLALVDAVDTGFGTVAYNHPNYAFTETLKKSGAWFAARKTYQQQQELAALLVKDGTKRPWNEFKKLAQPILGTYNERWLKTEYQTAIRSARNVSRYKEFEANKHLYPNLEYLPSRAATPRDEHKPFYHVVRPIDDDFWVKYMPPSAYNCVCGVEPTDAAVTELPTKEQTPEPAPGLGSNPAVTGELFDTDQHPYSEGIPDLKLIDQDGERIQKQIDYEILKAEYDFRLALKEIEPNISKFPKLEPEHLATIWGYSGSEYFDLNQFLRGAGKSDRETFFAAFQRTLSAALSLLPAKKGKVYRGAKLPTEVIDQYRQAFKEGKPITHLTYTSTSSDIKAAFNGNVKYIITSVNGRDISKISNFPNEKEVLFDVGTQFEITKIEEIGDKVFIHATEVKKSK